MSISTSISSPDVARQIQVLKYFPKITAKHYVPALKTSVAALASVISPNIPVLSSRAADTFGTKVTGRNIENLKGQVGWFDQDDPWYINVVESGATAHPIEPRGGRISAARASSGGGATTRLRFMGGGGEFVFARQVNHPGFSKRGFMAAGYAVTQPLVEREMSAAGEKVVAELAKI